MAITVKLPPVLEQSLRDRSAALGRSLSELIREALRTYLEKAPALPRQQSAYALGEDLFGAHRGPADLSSRRKEAAAGAWNEKQPTYGPKSCRR